MAILSCHVSIKLPPKISDGQENRPRVPLLNSIEPSIGWSHPLTKKGDACSLPTWQANLVEEPSNT